MVLSARERLRQAISELQIEAKKSLGQNFLVSDFVIEKIIQKVKDLKPDSLLEIGPGPGALTDILLEMKLPYQAIELDHKMAARWKGKGLEVFEEDALRWDWQQIKNQPHKVLVSNLPYQISASLVMDRSLDDDGIATMVLMFQKEVAQRIRAAAGSDAYGLLSVISQVFWSVETVTDAGPRDFDPPPKVASRVLSFQRRASPVSDKKKFLIFVKDCFAQRRKLLKSNLKSWTGSRQISVDEVSAWLVHNKFTETARAEELSPQQFLELYEHLNHSGK